MKQKWADLVEKALNEQGGEASLSDIYDRVFAMPEAIAKMGKRRGPQIDFRAQVRCIVQRDARFVKAGNKGWWRLVQVRGDVARAETDVARAETVEKIREEIKGTKLKRYRLRKETAILRFFECSDSGTNEQIIHWINKHLKNCHGRPIRHGEMSPRECGQVLKRMHFIEHNKVWYPPGAIPVEESTTESQEEDRCRRQKW